MPEVSGKARHCCARDRFGGQGTARPSCAACVVEAVVSTASRKRIVLGVCVRRRSVPQDATIYLPYGAMRSVSVSV